jgi:FkbM family methyltransferase
MNPPMENPNLSPDFVHAREVDLTPAPLKLLTFPDGFRCYTNSSVEETEFIYNEVFVKEEYLQKGLTLDDASCIFDIGANIGMFTILAKMKNSHAIVHAFEPIPESYKALVRNVDMHHLKHVFIHNYAVGSQDADRREFSYYPNMSGNSTAAPAVKENQLRLLEKQLGKDLTDFLFRAEIRYAPVRALSVFFERHGISSVDFMKIDVEGDELEVLRGIDRYHASRIRKLAIETHAPSIAAQVREALRQLGFSIFFEAGLPSLPDVSTIFAARSTGREAPCV